MKKVTFKREWCHLTLFEKVNLHLDVEFESNQLDAFMVALQLRKGVAVCILGLTIAFTWSDKKFIL